MKVWIQAARLRTLPLAMSSIIFGSACAIHFDFFNPWIFILALTTTVCLQILSNFANDYGDAVSGKDNEGRIGPSRAVSSGEIHYERYESYLRMRYGDVDEWIKELNIT